MNKSKTLWLPIVLGIEICFAILSFTLQWKTNQFNKNITMYNDEISQTDIEIKILKTEISHLTSIARIKEISNKFLPNYKNITNNDFIRVIDIPVNQHFE